MKVQAVVVSSLVAGLAMLFTAGAAGAAETSLIHEFAGSYAGVVTVTQSFSQDSGASRGSFHASKRKENGTLVLSSVVGLGGSTPVPIQEQYKFSGRSLTYILTAAGLQVGGLGTARISAKRISYATTINSGGDSATVIGTIRHSKKRLTVNEQLIASGGTIVFHYSLKRHHK